MRRIDYPLWRCAIGLQPDNRISDAGYYEREANQLETRHLGNSARLLGIEGSFDRDQADRLFRGQQPELADGKERKLTARIDKDRVGAWDWTFNVPKAVSVAELVGGDSRILEVREKAVMAAMKLIEKQARVRVRKSAEISKGKPKTWKFPARFTDNILFELYSHPSARDGSPHAHVHAKIYNLTYDKVESQWKAVELRYVDRKGVNDLYRQEMRKGLHQLGYKTARDGQEYTIIGFPAEVKGLFSTRHSAIEQKQQDMEARIGKPMGSKAKGKLSLFDRPDKSPDMPLKDRRAGWLSKLSDSQHRSIRGLVCRAKSSIKRVRLTKYLQKLRTADRQQETERENERSR